MRRVNTRGKEAAHKIMLLAATAYNLKKYLAFPGGPKTKVKALTKKLQNAFYFLVQPALRLVVTLMAEVERCATRTVYS